MSRKDTIIVAVLLNAGLLVVLFVSALKNEPAVAVAHTPPPRDRATWRHARGSLRHLVGVRPEQ